MSAPDAHEMPRVLWLFGLPGAGKTTLSRALAARWREAGRAVIVLDGDDLRRRLCSDLGFSEADRRENIRRAAEVARLFADAGFWVLAGFITPAAEMRGLAREIIGADRFTAVHVHCPVEVCARRDPKGHYREAGAGVRRDFTGVSAMFEPPAAGDCLTVDTSLLDAGACVSAIESEISSQAR
jgi:adenylylsulfate kinase